ncbi:trypsin-like peptidase domain-containing protein [bacterium]|nr:trypsin-like peptidase domain-containing protein [bacterium]
MRRTPLFLIAALFLSAASAGASSLRETPVVRAVRSAGPAVVNISASPREDRVFPFFGDPLYEKFFRDYFNMYPQPRRESALGSGLLIDERGYVLTNEHVVFGAGGLKVTLSDGTVFPARVIGTEPARDLAVLKVDAERPLPAARLGASAEIMIGETVIAIGSPYGLSNSVTTGVISSVGRTVRTEGDRVYLDFIQTDASINPGNSGGPLLNLDGEVIGINTAVHGRAQGIGFAIPIDSAKRVLADLIEHGKVNYGWFGLRVRDLPAETRTGGVLVTHVFAKTPAAAGGLLAGDVVTEIDGHPVADSGAYRGIVSGYTVGETADFKIVRRTDEMTLNIRPERFPVAMVDPYAMALLGFRLVPATPRQARAFGLAPGKTMIVRDIRADSAAAQVGVRPGDAVLEIENRAVTDAASYQAAVASLRLKSSAVVLVQRGGTAAYLSLPLP